MWAKRRRPTARAGPSDPRRVALLVLLLQLALLVTLPLPVRGDSYLGLSLEQALRRLQSPDLRIVFTSELVRPEMEVRSEPDAVGPRQILDQLLAPHGLRAEDRAGGLVVVVKAPPSDDPADPLDSAAAEPTEPMPYIEDEIVVRPSRLSLLHEAPEAPLSLSRRDIENLPHLARDVLRALTLFPGVAGSDISAELQIHGGRRDETQVLLDGQELYDAFHLKDFDNAASVVASQGLDGVSLSTGAFAADRGDRMSGVLDMRTRSPSGPLRTELGLSFTEAYALSGGGLGGRAESRGERGGWLVSGRRGFVDFAGRALGDEDPSFWDLFGKVATQLGAAHQVRLHGLRADDELDFLRTLDGVDERFDTGYDATYGWLTHQAILGSRGLVTTTGSWSRLDRDRQGGESDPEDDEGFQVFDRRDSEILGFQQHWDWHLQEPRGTSHTLEWGFLLRRYDTRYDYSNDFVLDDMDFNTPLSRPPVPRFQGAFRGEHAGAYVSDRITPPGRLTFELGLRYDRHTLTDDTLVSPRVHLAWKLGDRQVLRAAWGHYYQSQRTYELQVEDGETDFFPAERSEHWVLGYEALLGSRETAWLQALRVEAYRRDIRDPRPRFENLFEAFSAFPEVEADRVQIVPESSRAAGLEVVLRGALGSSGGARWWANYALSSAEDVLDPTDGSGSRTVPRKVDQTHALNLHVEQSLGRHWRLNLAWRFHTGWPTTPVFLVVEEGENGEGENGGDGEEGEESGEGEEEGPDLSFGLGPLNSERVSQYHRLDLRASRSWSLRRGELTFFVDIQNVYDRRNESGTDFEIDDEAEALVRKREAWPGILPSVGLRWEF